VLGRLQGIGFLGTFLALALVWGALQITSLLMDGNDHQDRILRIFWLFAGAVAIIGAFTIRKFPESVRDRRDARLAPRVTWRRFAGAVVGCDWGVPRPKSTSGK